MTRNVMTLPQSHLGPIEDGLAAFTAPTATRHARWSNRIAVTFMRRSPITNQAIHCEAWDLVVLQARTIRHDGQSTRRLPVAVFRPRLDLAVDEQGRPVGTGRIYFECVKVRDLAIARSMHPAQKLSPARDGALASTALAMAQALEDAGPAVLSEDLRLPKVFWVFSEANPPVYEAAYTREQWEQAKVVIDDCPAWPAEMFTRPLHARYDVHPVDGSPDPWASENPPEGLVSGSWCLRDGLSYPSAQLPVTVVTHLGPFLGRNVRNPAYAALRSEGLLGNERPYPAWREQYAEPTPAGVTYPEALWTRSSDGPDVAENNAAAWEEQMNAVLELDSTRLEAVLEKAAAACEAAGVPYDPRDRAHSDMAELLRTPWSRMMAPNRTQIQVIGLAGPASPETLGYVDLVHDFNLYDFGRRSAGYVTSAPRKSAIAKGHQWPVVPTASL